MAKTKKQSEAIASKMPAMKPTVHLSSKDLKAIEDWEVGETYELKLKVTMKSRHESEDEPVSASFDIDEAESD